MHFVSWMNVPSMEKLCGSQLSQNECTVKMIKGLSYSLWVLLRPLVLWTAMGKKNLSSYPLSYKDESLKALACYMWLANGLICCLPLIVFQEKTNASGCRWHTHKSLRRHILAGLAHCPLGSWPAYVGPELPWPQIGCHSKSPVENLDNDCMGNRYSHSQGVLPILTWHSEAEVSMTPNKQLLSLSQLIRNVG